MMHRLLLASVAAIVSLIGTAEILAAPGDWQPKPPIFHRYRHGVVELAGELWCVGGQSSGGGPSEESFRNDVWKSADGINWTCITPAASFSRRGGFQMLAFDSNLWVIGGESYTSSPFSSWDDNTDVWSSPDGVTWTQVTGALTVFGEPKDYAGVVFAGKMWLIGRSRAYSSLDGATWTLETSSASFGDRTFPSCVELNGELYLYGGYDGVYATSVYKSTDAITWTQTTANGGFAGRWRQAGAAYDNKLWMVGGELGAGYFSDAWSSPDGITWTQTTASLPFGQRTATVALPWAGELHIFFGNSGPNDGSCRDIWSTTDGATWTDRTPVPHPLAKQSGVGLNYDNKLWLIAGASVNPAGPSVSQQTNDVWYSADGQTWSQATASAAFTARTRLTGTVHDGKMWIAGGLTGVSTRLNDVHWSTDGVTWTQATSSAGFAARVGHAMLTLGGEMFVIGGNTSGGNQSDVWSSTDGIAWTLETSSPGWTGRQSHASTVHDNKLWVISGSSGATQFTDVWSSADGSTWTQAVAVAPFPTRASGRVASADGRLWLVGGSNSPAGFLDDTWRSTNGIDWVQVTNVPGFFPRDSHQLTEFDGDLYLIGGRGQALGPEVWVLDNLSLVPVELTAYSLE